jgi:hypothetical protein
MNIKRFQLARVFMEHDCDGGANASLLINHPELAIVCVKVRAGLKQVTLFRFGVQHAVVLSIHLADESEDAWHIFWNARAKL